MTDVKVGMRLRSPFDCYEITVTELTEHGFKYRYDSPRVVHPRLGITIAEDGHEHFGVNGEALYEPVPIAV